MVKMEVTKSGVSVSSAGDVNRDGYDDVIIGAPFTDYNGFRSGSSYVVFGKAAALMLPWTSLPLDGSNGFRLDGENQGDRIGFSVSSAGDVNGDDYDDLIIGAHGTGNNGWQSGSSYVVFGKGGGFSASMDLSALDGSNGFRLDGVNQVTVAAFQYHQQVMLMVTAMMMSSLGHMAQAITALTVGSSYVVFGKASGFSASMDLSALDGSNGFRLVV